MKNTTQVARLEAAGFDQYLIECLLLDDTDLDHEFTRVAADLAYWNAQYTAALKEWLMAKAGLKRLRAELFAEHRVSLTAEELAEDDDPAAGGKAKRPRATPRVTDSRVAAAVDCDPRVVQAERALIEAEVLKVEMQCHADEMHVKKDALQSLGAKLRRELDGDAWVRQRTQLAREAAVDREADLGDE